MNMQKQLRTRAWFVPLHPHTGTPIETEEEVYFVMENLNTTYMKFGPDVGQLGKRWC